MKTPVAKRLTNEMRPLPQPRRTFPERKPSYIGSIGTRRVFTDHLPVVDFARSPDRCLDFQSRDKGSLATSTTLRRSAITDCWSKPVAVVDFARSPANVAAYHSIPCVRGSRATSTTLLRRPSVGPANCHISCAKLDRQNTMKYKLSPAF